jgi:hypothetical protein
MKADLMVEMMAVSWVEPKVGMMAVLTVENLVEKMVERMVEM